MSFALPPRLLPPRLRRMGVCERSPTLDIDLFVDVFFLVRVAGRGERKTDGHAEARMGNWLPGIEKQEGGGEGASKWKREGLKG